MANAIDRIKKLHAAQAIERKDKSLKDFVGAAESVIMDVKGFSSKFVDKYATTENKGYFTMIYLADGTKIGAFSNALHEFADFFYNGAGIDRGSLFKKIDFNEGHIEVKVSKVALDKGKSTYNFEIVDGEIGQCALMSDGNSGGPMLLEGQVQ